MANMFSTAKAGQFRDTYAEVPFAEIGKMGDKLQKRTEKAEDMTSAIGEMMNVDALGDADFAARKADQDAFQDRLSSISDMHYSDANQAIRDARAMAQDVAKWKTTGRGGAMQKSYDDYQNNIKMINSAVAKGGLDVDTEKRLKREAKAAYQGVGEGGDEGYGTYNQVLPAVIEEGFTQQADKLIKGWKSDGSYTLKTDPATGQSYYINEQKERVDEGEVRAALEAGMRNPTNDAWARQSAKTQMSKLDPNQQEFQLPNGSVVNRAQMEDMLMEDEYAKAIDFAAPKASFDKTKASLNANWLMKQQHAAAAKAKTTLDSFTTSGGGFINITNKNVDDLTESVKDLKINSRNIGRSVNEYKAANPNSTPQNDPVLADLIGTQERNSLVLAEQESYLYKPRLEADKLIDANVGSFQFLDKKNPGHPSKHDWQTTDAGGNFRSPIYGLADELMKSYSEHGTGDSRFDKALTEIREGKTPELLNKFLQEGVRDGVSFKDLLNSVGANGEKYENQYTAGTPLGTMSEYYLEAKVDYANAIETSMKEDPAQVDNYRFISGIEDGKYSSGNAKLQEEVSLDIVRNAGQGYSSPDGRQLNEWMEDEFGDSWKEEYGKFQKVDIQQTSGYTAGGKPILNMTVIDEDGVQHSLPIIGKSSDMYLRTGREMSNSRMPETRKTGVTMVQNATPFGTSTIGSVVKGAGLESMFTSGNKARAEVKAPLNGFKKGGKQLYVQPKEVAGGGMRLYQMVDEDGDVVKDNIGGANDLRKILHGKAVEFAQKEGNAGFLNLYGLGK